jgi:hypothetical protein
VQSFKEQVHYHAPQPLFIAHLASRAFAPLSSPMVLLPAEKAASSAEKAASAEIAAFHSCCQIGACRIIPVKAYCSECHLPSCQWCYEVYRGTTIPICGECDPFEGIYVREGRIVKKDMYRSKAPSKAKAVAVSKAKQVRFAEEEAPHSAKARPEKKKREYPRVRSTRDPSTAAGSTSRGTGTRLGLRPKSGVSTLYHVKNLPTNLMVIREGRGYYEISCSSAATLETYHAHLGSYRRVFLEEHTVLDYHWGPVR